MVLLSFPFCDENGLRLDKWVELPHPIHDNPYTRHMPSKVGNVWGPRIFGSPGAPMSENCRMGGFIIGFGLRRLFLPITLPTLATQAYLRYWPAIHMNARGASPLAAGTITGCRIGSGRCGDWRCWGSCVVPYPFWLGTDRGGLLVHAIEGYFVEKSYWHVI